MHTYISSSLAFLYSTHYALRYTCCVSGMCDWEFCMFRVLCVVDQLNELWFFTIPYEYHIILIEIIQFESFFLSFSRFYLSFYFLTNFPSTSFVYFHVIGLRQSQGKWYNFSCCWQNGNNNSKMAS